MVLNQISWSFYHMQEKISFFRQGTLTYPLDQSGLLWWSGLNCRKLLNLEISFEFVLKCTVSLIEHVGIYMKSALCRAVQFRVTFQKSSLQK